MNMNVLQIKVLTTLALLTWLISIPAYAEKCNISPMDRASLRVADRPVLTQLSHRLTGQAKDGQLKLFLTYEFTRTNAFGGKYTVCNQPSDRELDRFRAIAERLGIESVQLRKMIKFLIKSYPKETLAHSTDVRFDRILTLLEQFAASGRSDLKVYLSQVEKFRKDFNAILQPGRIIWSIGMMPMDHVLNKEGQDRNQLFADIHHQVFSWATHTAALSLHGLDTTIMRTGDIDSVFLINDNLADYAQLMALKMTPAVAAVAITDELRREGHGYLGKAARDLQERAQSLTCKTAFTN